MKHLFLERVDKLDLPNVTLICVDCIKQQSAINAINSCHHLCNFGNTNFLTNHPYDNYFGFNKQHIEIIGIDPFEGREGYSKFCLLNMHEYIDTPFALICQWDGFVTNHLAWNDFFYDYDYISSLFNPIKNKPLDVGNGGLSLRSNKLLDILPKLIIDSFIIPKTWLYVVSIETFFRK
jgi:hypothetical protein